ncbi:hypothetical protein ACWM9A_05335 [Acetobacter pasteurianus]
MGFIGGGAILRRENMVLGVTTTATLWIVTIIGLYFGSVGIVIIYGRQFFFQNWRHVWVS